MFEGGRADRPIIMGVLEDPDASAEQDDTGAVEAANAPPARDPQTDADRLRSGEAELHVDGKRIELQAAEEMFLRCGKASIHLTKDGKVIVKGSYLVQRSSGLNKIKGASVQIN